MDIVDTYREQDEDHFHLEGPVEFVVDDTASMMVTGGEVTFVNRSTGDSVSMSEWDFSNLDLAYLHARLEQKNPRIKEHRLEMEALEEQEKGHGSQESTA